MRNTRDNSICIFIEIARIKLCTKMIFIFVREAKMPIGRGDTDRGERELYGHTLKYRRYLSLWAERQFSSTAAVAAASGFPGRTTAKWYSEKSWKELHTKGNRHSMSHPPTRTRTQTNTNTSTDTDREHESEREKE